MPAEILIDSEPLTCNEFLDLHQAPEYLSGLTFRNPELADLNHHGQTYRLKIG